jgi:hypothetical protein
MSIRHTSWEWVAGVSGGISCSIPEVKLSFHDLLWPLVSSPHENIPFDKKKTAMSADEGHTHKTTPASRRNGSLSVAYGDATRPAVSQ